MKLSRTQASLAWYIFGSFLIIFSVIIAYRSSLLYEFQFDDLANISKHFNIRHYTLSQLFFSGTRWISYWLNALFYSIGKFNPFAYRVGAVVIHTLNALSVFALFSVILPRAVGRYAYFFTRHASLLALVTALIFALHPVQTQTVSYVIQAELEGMATLMILLMALLFIACTRVKTIPLNIVTTGALFVVAAFSTGTKEIAIIGPVLVMLLDWFFVSQGSMTRFKQNLKLHIPLITLVFGTYIYLLKPAFFVNALGLQMEAKNNIGNIITARPGAVITPLHYLISQFKVIVHYFFIFLWPFNISVEYDWKLVDSFFAIDCIVPLCMLLGIGVLIGVLLRQNKTHPIAFGLLWFCVALAPRSTIIPSPELLVDYKTYLGSCGWLFAIASGVLFFWIKLISYLKNRYLIRYGHYIVVPLSVLLCSPLAIMRNKVWSSGTDFWLNVIANAPGKARAYNNYGVELSQNYGKFKESIPYFQKAIAMDPLYPDPCNNLAVAYGSIGQVDNAIFAMRQGLTLYPYYPEGYNNLASFYLQKKDHDSAEKALNIALSLRPYYGKAHYNMGRLYLEKGSNDKAWEHFKACCTQGDLDNEVGYEAYGQASLLCQKYDDAEKAYKMLVSIQSNNNEFLFGLANAYFFQKKYDNAKQVYEQGVRNNPQDARFWYNLGETLFAMQDFKNAIPLFEKVVSLPQKPFNAVVRLATCYEVMGNPQRSYEVLASLKTTAQPGVDVQNIVATLEQMKQKYPHIKIT